MATQMSKKRKSVADGFFLAELNEFLTRELVFEGYTGVEVTVAPMRTEIILRATRIMLIVGWTGTRLWELASVVQKRFNFPENSVELYVEKIRNKGLCAIAQAECLRYKLLVGLAVREDKIFVHLIDIMFCFKPWSSLSIWLWVKKILNNADIEMLIVVSGKIYGHHRAKSMKIKDGYMISSGQPGKEYIDSAVRFVALRRGVLGLKVKIMLDRDPNGKQGPTTLLPDLVTIHPPEEEEE
ncbi:40S ribosomal protein S3 [Quillaja saponaria]|uniref:40S ribosomal protein S3 n=1 Tax=Quillaja saponaria TaxID=32244 RepID=A0AAD7PE35_QUISA|nr:40S ribosomal protein S3 [Quillaja saponaria]